MPATTDTSFLDSMVANVAIQFHDRVQATPHAEAFRYPEGESWKSVTWKEASDMARLAAGLLALGLELEQRVGIASSTRYEWILADLAVMFAGGATTTVYPTTNVDDTAYILGDAECRFVFAEDDEQLAKIAEPGELPTCDRRWSPSTARPTASGSSASTTSRKLGDKLPRRPPGRDRGDRGRSRRTSWPR